MLELKRKLEFRGHVYFQAVRPQLIENALNWLKQNNPLYSNVTTQMNNISINLKNLGQNEVLDTHASTDECSTSCNQLQ